MIRNLDDAAVISALGPDLSAVEWARRLGLSVSEVRAIARNEGVVLAGDQTVPAAVVDELVDALDEVWSTK